MRKFATENVLHETETAIVWTSGAFC